MRPNLRTEQEIMKNWKGTKPVVSICCLAYNHESYIEDALEGFLIQETDFPFEVLIHDDASTDRTADIIREYEAAYPLIIKPIYQKENQYSKHVKIGSTYLYPRMQGEYIAFCEGDDYWANPQKLQTQYNLIIINPSFCMVTHFVQCLNNDNSLNSRVIPSFGEKSNKTYLYNLNNLAQLLFVENPYPFHTSSYFIKKSVLLSKERNELLEYFNGDMSLLYSSLIFGGIIFQDTLMSYRRLLTPGNYNTRYMALGSQKKHELLLHNIDGLIVINEKYTKKKYNTYIANLIYQKITSSKFILNTHTWKQALKLIKRVKTPPRQPKLMVKIILFLFLPYLFKVISDLIKIKRKIVRAIMLTYCKIFD